MGQPGWGQQGSPGFTWRLRWLMSRLGQSLARRTQPHVHVSQSFKGLPSMPIREAKAALSDS